MAETKVTYSPAFADCPNFRLYHFRREVTAKVVEAACSVIGVDMALPHKRYDVWITKAERYDWPEVDRDLAPVFEAFEEGLFSEATP